MKKILATILALTMIVGMGIIPAFAEEAPANSVKINSVTEDNTTDITASVTVKTNPNDGHADTTSKIYSVTVSWIGDDEGGLKFTYNDTDYDYVWNPATLQYDKRLLSEEGDGWNAESANITVTNSSNAAVKVSAEFERLSNGFTLENASFTLASAAEGITEPNVPGEATSGDIKVTPPQTVTKDMVTNIVVTIDTVQ